MRVSLRCIFSEYTEPHQLAALQMLEEHLAPELLAEDAEWLVCFLAAPKPKNYNEGKA